jgi:tRNA (guanine37-N1)-methyltransferase
LRKRLKEKFSNSLTAYQLSKVYNSFDIIGDIAIIKTSNANSDEAKLIANKILAIHKNVKSVFTQTSGIKIGYRTRELKYLAGENRTVTEYKESGCIFEVDIGKCYFSPRLSYERKRISKLVNSGETVVNMFSGVGCFSVIIAKSMPSAKVYSIDINPSAVEYLGKNICRNHLYASVIPLLGDAKKIVESQLVGVADRVLMPLPELALKYLSTAICALKPSGGWIHYHDFEHAASIEDPIEKSIDKVSQTLDSISVGYRFANSRVIRSTGPNWWHIVLDIHVTNLPSKF